MNFVFYISTKDNAGNYLYSDGVVIANNYVPSVGVQANKEYSVIVTYNNATKLFGFAFDNRVRYVKIDENFAGLEGIDTLRLFGVMGGSSLSGEGSHIGQWLLYDRGLTPVELEQLANYRTAILRS